MYHIPVLLNESVEGLNIYESGIYVDVTFGGGGHSREILKKIKSGKLIAFDQDSDTKDHVDEILKSNKDTFIFFQANFKYVQNYLRYAGFEKVDGILADLGVSSHQLNEKDRGFSFRLGGIPDMRMNKDAETSALTIVNDYSEEQLASVLRNYGELRGAGKLAKFICSSRNENKIQKLEQLNEVINKAFKTNKEFKILAKVYQALRIETNDELNVLKSLLEQSAKILKPKGRLVVISYHSLEDRLVKNFLRFNNFEGDIKTDVFGKKEVEFKEINKKVIVPGEEEIKNNNRSRSAKLRIAEKL